MGPRLLARFLMAMTACTASSSQAIGSARGSEVVSRDATSVIDLASQLPGGSSLVVGSPTKEQLGNDLAGGDLNGDGVTDLFVGAHWWTTGGRNIIGRAYGLFGRAGWPAQIDLALTNQRDWTFTGRGLEARLGNAVAVGDLSGDGVADAAMGSLLADPVDPMDTTPPIGLLSNGGAVYVAFGGPKAGGNVDFLGAEPDVYLAGDSSQEGADQLGTALAIGDLNGDGHEDLVVAAALRRSFRGSVFGWWGPLARGRRIFLAQEAADWRIDGPADRSYFGVALAIGDLSGDDKADLAVAAVDDDGVPGGRGSVHLFTGGPTFGTPKIRAAGEADTLVLPPDGVALGSALSLGGCSCRGQSLAIADLTGDGRPDLVAGAPLVNRLAGEVRVVPGPLPAGRTDLSEQAHLRISGAVDDGRLGWSLAAGDLGGDRAADLVMAAPWADAAGRSDTGLAFALRGPLPASGDWVLGAEDLPLVVQGPMAQSGLAGMSLLVADSDGDGVGDLHLGFPDAAPAARRSVGSLYRLPGPLLPTVTLSPTALPPPTTSPTPEPSPAPSEPPAPSPSPTSAGTETFTPVPSPQTPTAGVSPATATALATLLPPSSTATPELARPEGRLLLPLLLRTRRR